MGVIDKDQRDMATFDYLWESKIHDAKIQISFNFTKIGIKRGNSCRIREINDKRAK